MSKRKTLEEANAEAAQAAELQRIEGQRGPNSVIQVTPVRWQCYAHGCPCFASTSHGEFHTICRFHLDVVPDRWPQITKVLRELEPLVTIATGCSSDAWVAAHRSWAHDADVVIDSLGLDDDLKPREMTLDHGPKRNSTERFLVARNERFHPKLYAYRLNAWIRQQCFSDVELPPRDRRLSASEQAIGLGQAVARLGLGARA